MDGLAARLANPVQLTTDGHKAYLQAVDEAFKGEIDYGMLVKVYGASLENAKGRYSPVECIGAFLKRPGATPMSSTSPRSTWSARTSTCGWGCAGSLA